MMVKILDDYLNFTNPIIMKYKGQRLGQLNLNLKRLSQIGLFKTLFNILLVCKKCINLPTVLYIVYIFMVNKFKQLERLAIHFELC